MEEKEWIKKGMEFWEKKDYEHAVECFREGDKAGELDCTTNLGICYYWGQGVEADLQKSAFYNEKAAKGGIPMAMFDTGMNYEHGLGVSQNIEKAIYWFEKAADKQYSKAFIALGDIYYVGEFVEKDLEKAFHYYQEADKLGNRTVKLLLAGFYAEGLVTEKDTEQAKKLYQEAYDYLYEEATLNNDNEAQFRLGTMFFNGRPEIGLLPDYEQALEWYEKAAEGGNGHAENNLGMMYYLGLGVGQNYELAFSWFQKASARKDVNAISSMGNCYYNGRGVEKDYVKAAECYSKAANLGYAHSQGTLGMMYMEGKGVEQNYTKAVYWMKKCCKNGFRGYYSNLADCYRKGLGLDKDEKKAFELYRKGADLGDLRSKVSMAECLIEGWGTDCDLGRAYKILQEICNDEQEYREQHVSMIAHEDEKGHHFLEDPLDEENLPHYAKAYYLLGTLTYAGKGPDGTDAPKALALLRMAERLGYNDEDHKGTSVSDLINKIEDEAEVTGGTNNSYIEIRDLGYRGKMGRYDIYVHHADGTESNVRFGTDRRKFCYLLLLLLVSNKDSVQGLMARFFCYGRDRLVSLAKLSLLADEEGPDKWVEKFIYSDEFDDEKKEWRYVYANWMYSNEVRKASEFFSEVCSDEELELYKIRSTGGRNSITSIAVKPEKIVVPESLVKYTKDLPTREFMLNYKQVMRRSGKIELAKRLYAKYYENWNDGGSSDQLSE